MQAASARTKGDVVRVGSSAVGLVDVSIADDTDVYRVAVADMDIASGARGRYQITGRCTITSPSLSVAAGDGLLILDGAVADSATTAQKPSGVTSNTHFAVNITASTSATTQDVFLYGDGITGTT
jgi:hypothetical protein